MIVQVLKKTLQKHKFKGGLKSYACFIGLKEINATFENNSAVIQSFDSLEANIPAKYPMVIGIQFKERAIIIMAP